MKIEVELQPMQTPNYVLVKRGSGAPCEGEAKFHVSELSAEALAQLCDTFRRELFKKAGKRDPEWDMPSRG